ncbi:MAG TPA: trypsin-like peptidase domain-containing protein [Planctomycetota bacterium]|nr:trypsin-like peptidase domain-containing protein [Planctomycetota bacterium]
MKVFAVLRMPLLLLGAFGAVAMDWRLHHPAPAQAVPVSAPILPAPAAPAPPAPARAPGLLVPDLLERVTPSVVSVFSLRAGPSPHDSESSFSGPAGDDHGFEPNVGSGVIVRSNGYIVTNHHVIEAADDIKVRLWDHREFRATVIGRDPRTDLSVLRIEAEGLSAIPFADSGAVRVGEPVLAIGNALGLGQTVSSGIIGARGRSGLGVAAEEDFLETDASMNPGSSGGPLLNLKGELVGINTAIATRTGGFQGIGLVIPSRLVQEIVDALLRDGKIDRGWLGVMVQDLTPDLAVAFNLTAARGVIVTEVCPQGPAAKAGLRRGDIILAIDAHPVATRFDLDHHAAMRGATTTITLRVWRKGKSMELHAQLEPLREQPPPPAEMGAEEDPEGQPSGLDGVTVRPVPPKLLRESGIADEEGGLLVTGLERPGRFAGLRRGDLIVEVNGRPVRDIDHLLEGLCLKGSSVLVRVRRPEGSVYLLVPY